MVFPLEDFSQPYVLVDGLEPFLDIFILILIEVLKFLSLVRLFVQSDRTVAISFPRGICTYCLDLAVGFELRRELVGVIVMGVIRRLVLFIRRGISEMARYGVVVVGAGLGRFEGGTCGSLSGSNCWGFTRWGCWSVGSWGLAMGWIGIHWYSIGEVGHSDGRWWGPVAT